MVEDIKQPSDIELLDAAIHIMRAIIDYLTFKEAKVFSQFNEDNFKLILNNEIRTQDINANIRSNMMRILGTLALNLIRNKNHESYNMAKVSIYIALSILQFLLSGFFDHCSLLIVYYRNYAGLLHEGKTSMDHRRNYRCDDGPVREG